MKVLGIDIGGSGIKGAIVDTKTGLLLTERIRIPTPQPATPEAIIDTVTELVVKFDWKGYIGCGFPAAVKNEIVKTASNIDKSWIGVNASALIMKATGCPAHVVNDVDAAGLAEIKFGAGKGKKGTTIMIAAGTGIGTAIFINKKLVPNTELGFIQLKGKSFPAEHYAANSVRENENLNWEDWGLRLNEYLQRMESLFWPNLFIIGGGVSKNFDDFSQYINVEAEVVPAESRNHAGIIGAAIAAKSIKKF